jgi:hypothetical protein
MTNEDKIKSLCLIKAELEQWLATMPEWYYRLHGCKDTNIAYQLCKKLIEDAILNPDDDSDMNQCLGIQNEL